MFCLAPLWTPFWLPFARASGEHHFRPVLSCIQRLYSPRRVGAERSTQCRNSRVRGTGTADSAKPGIAVPAVPDQVGIGNRSCTRTKDPFRCYKIAEDPPAPQTTTMEIYARDAPVRGGTLSNCAERPFASCLHYPSHRWARAEKVSV